MNIINAVDPSLLHPYFVTPPSPTSVERALYRFMECFEDLTFHDINLEGYRFTKPEISTLIDGGKIYTASSRAKQEVLGIGNTVQYVIDRISSGCGFDLDWDISDEINGIIAERIVAEPGVMRCFSMWNIPIAVGLHDKDKFYPYPAKTLLEARKACEAVVMSCPDPYNAALNYAALASYCQFYVDGNKRTARYMMNGYLIANGYDPLMIVHSRIDEYNAALGEMFYNANLAPYIELLHSSQIK